MKKKLEYMKKQYKNAFRYPNQKTREASNANSGIVFILKLYF